MRLVISTNCRGKRICVRKSCCKIAPDNLKLPSEMPTLRITLVIARNDPLAATTTLQFWDPIWIEQFTKMRQFRDTEMFTHQPEMENPLTV